MLINSKILGLRVAGSIFGIVAKHLTTFRQFLLITLYY
jgi:hypothetical protein